MKTKKIRGWIAGISVVAAIAFAGCSTSGGQQKTMIGNNNAESDVKGDVNTISSNTQDVFKDMGINLSGSQIKNSGAQRELDGMSGDKQVTVDLSSNGNGMTHVEVTAKEGTLQWNQDYANSVLSKIIEKS
jgi:hypothetical protein